MYIVGCSVYLFCFTWHMLTFMFIVCDFIRIHSHFIFYKIHSMKIPKLLSILLQINQMNRTCNILNATESIRKKRKKNVVQFFAHVATNSFSLLWKKRRMYIYFRAAQHKEEKRNKIKQIEMGIANDLHDDNTNSW